MPEVSIVMPVYNAAATLQATLDSVLRQSFRDYEFIMVDDGSTDGTLPLLEAAGDPRMRVLSQPNRGSYPARNAGLALATGEFIAFLDADDLWTEDKLACQVQALRRHPEAGLAYSWTEYIDAAGRSLNYGVYWRHEGFVLLELLGGNFIASGSNPLVRRSALDAVGLFDERFHTAGDWDLWLRLAARYPFALVAKPQVLRRRSDNHWSANLQRQDKAAMQVLEKNFASLPAAWQALRNNAVAHYSWRFARRIVTVHGTSLRLPDRATGRLAGQALLRSLRNRPGNLRRWREWLPLAVRILLIRLLPAEHSHRLIAYLRGLHSRLSARLPSRPAVK